MTEHRVLTSCAECGPALSIQTDPDQVPTDPHAWAELVENLTGDVVPAAHNGRHALVHASHRPGVSETEMEVTQ